MSSGFWQLSPVCKKISSMTQDKIGLEKNLGDLSPLMVKCQFKYFMLEGRTHFGPN